MIVLKGPAKARGARDRRFRLRPPASRRAIDLAPKTRTATDVLGELITGGGVVQEPKIISVRPDHLVNAHFVPPSTIKLTFDDASFPLAIELLEMPMDRIRWRTAEALPTGDGMTVRGIRSDLITIAAGTLRYLVDTAYAAKTDAALKASQFTRDELKGFAHDNPPPPEWFSEPARDLRRESWK